MHNCIYSIPSQKQQKQGIILLSLGVSDINSVLILQNTYSIIHTAFLASDRYSVNLGGFLPL